MHSIVRSALIATTYLALSVRALPRPQPTYSVVNVDGNTQSASVSPVTIYQTITDSSSSETTVSIIFTETPTTTPAAIPPPATSTLITTSVVMQESTSIVTGNIPSNTVVVEQPSFITTYVSDGFSVTTTATEMMTEYTAAPSPASPEESTVTVVSISTPTTTSYYDNGMWHTSYAIKESSPTSTSTWDSTVPYISEWYHAPTGTGATSYNKRSMPTGFSQPSWNVTFNENF